LIGGFEFYLHEMPLNFDAMPSILKTTQAKVNKNDSMASIRIS